MALDVNNGKEEVIDPYNHKERWENWNKHLDSLSKENEKAIVQYLEDMRRGKNIAPQATKGKRSYTRLNTQKHRLKRVCELLQKNYGTTSIMPESEQNIKKLKERATEVFERMENGEILTEKGLRTKGGRKYKSTLDYIKGFKAYWHWYMTYKHNEEGKIVPDITEYITTNRNEKPQFVYFGEVGGMSAEEGFKKLMDNAKPTYKGGTPYKVLMAFLFDSGIRAPTELINVKRKDITPLKNEPYLLLNIREETAKTFGRKIKLMLCHEILKEYLEENNFKPDNFIFPEFKVHRVNEYLKRLAKNVLGKDGTTMYDFRHNSACYWLPRYKNENAIMYRFGWKKSNMIHYYTEYLGMKDTIQDEDLLIDITKTDLEKSLEEERKQRQILEDQMKALQRQIQDIQDTVIKKALKHIQTGKAEA